MRCNQSKLNAVRCCAVQEQRCGVPREKIFFFSILRSPNLLFARSGVSRLVSGGSRAIRRFAPPRASSLPLPLSPTGSGAWTCWRGPGDHSTHRRISGIPQKVSAMRRVWAPLANPNRLAAVRCNQSKLNAVRCCAVQEQRCGVPREKIFFFSILRSPNLLFARSGVSRLVSGGSRAIRRFAPPRASSLPLPLSPTGSGAWTCWRGPGDHSTLGVIRGPPAKVFRHAPSLVATLLTLADWLP